MHISMALPRWQCTVMTASRSTPSLCSKPPPEGLHLALFQRSIKKLIARLRLSLVHCVRGIFLRNHENPSHWRCRLRPPPRRCELGVRTSGTKATYWTARPVAVHNFPSTSRAEGLHPVTATPRTVGHGQSVSLISFTLLYEQTNSLYIKLSLFLAYVWIACWYQILIKTDLTCLESVNCLKIQKYYEQ